MTAQAFQRCADVGKALTPLLIAVNSRHRVTAGLRVLAAPAAA
jgi:hypothetical protein